MVPGGICQGHLHEQVPLVGWGSGGWGHRCAGDVCSCSYYIRLFFCVLLIRGLARCTHLPDVSVP